MALRNPVSGTLVDHKYRIAERIGGGGMGDVYRAENVLAGRSVAIKFLRSDLVDNPEIAQRFFQEAQAVNRIRHPNIVEVLDAGIGETGPYMVMEHLDGESVGAVLARMGRLDIDASVGTAIPVLEALDAAHRVGIVHRDLKPENVFIAFDASRGAAVVRLLDFGIAKVLDPPGPSPRTRTGIVFGTPDYLSPEQATGEAPLDGRSDLFSVGVLLYELLTGTRPFRAATPVATAFRVVHAEAPNLAASGIHVDARLEAVVAKLLQKVPANRFPTAGDVVRELDRVVPDTARRALALGRIINVARRSGREGGAREGPPFESGTTPLGSAFGLASAVPSGDRESGPSIPRWPTGSVESGPPSSRPSGLRHVSSLVPGRSNESSPPSREGRGPAKSEFPPGRGPASAESSPPGSDLERAAKERRSSVRPFPEQFAGRFHVRGPVLRSVDHAIIDVFGVDARTDIVHWLPSCYSADFRNDSINALVAYDLEALDGYMELATAVLLHDVERWRELGQRAVGGELAGVVRSVLRPASDLSAVLRRGASIWARLFSFGSWRVASGAAGKVALHVAEFGPASLPLRLWVLGVVEESARRALGTDVSADVTVGEIPFSPELVCEIG